MSSGSALVQRYARRSGVASRWFGLLVAAGVALGMPSSAPGQNVPAPEETDPNAPLEETDPNAPPEETDPNAAESTGAPEQGRQPPSQLGPDALGRPPEWHWRQVLSSPRVGDELTCIAVDALHPERIYVGTQGTSLVRSLDGGNTWTEVQIGPWLDSANIQAIDPPSVPSPQSQAHTVLDLDQSYPPHYEDATHLGRGMNLDVNTLNVLEGGAELYLGMPLSTPPPAPGILFDVTYTSPREQDPIRQIRTCPGGAYELIVATSHAVVGSNDAGQTFTRLFHLPERVLFGQDESPISAVDCSPSNPNDIAIGTSEGLFRSTDGGVTFNHFVNGLMPGGINAVTFAPSPEPGGAAVLLLGAGDVLYIGDPDADSGLEWVYPDFDDQTTAPYGDINWITVTPSGEGWLATDDNPTDQGGGVRASYDGGYTWINPARMIFDRKSMLQVVVGMNDTGGERLIAISAEEGYSSDDHGHSWHPILHGLTRKPFRQIASAPADPDTPARWWVVTANEVWATYVPPNANEEDLSVPLARWAVRALERTPSMRSVIDTALEHNGLSNDQIADLGRRAVSRNWLPRVDLTFDPDYQGHIRREVLNTEARVEDENFWRSQYEANAQLTWFLPDEYIKAGNPLGEERKPLFDLRNQIGARVEETWHERVTLLQQAARGLGDPVQIETVRARVEMLDAMLGFWCGRPVAQVNERR